MKRNYGIVAGVIVLLLGGLFFFLAADRTMASPPAIDWSLQFGSPSADACTAVAISEQGCLYVVGSTDGALAGSNSGGTDIFVEKRALGGELQWRVQRGSSGDDGAADIAIDMSGNAYVVGYSNGDMFGANAGGSDCVLAKYSTEGQFLWGKQFGTSSGDFANGVCVDNAGNVIVVGDTEGDLFQANAEEQSSDTFIVKYSSGGSLLWSRQFGQDGDDTAAAVAADTEGNIYVVGRSVRMHSQAGLPQVFLAKHSSTDGSVLWGKQLHSDGTKTHAASCVSIARDGSVVIGGTRNIGTTSDDSGSSDGFAAKYDISGNQVWIRALSVPGATGIVDAAVDDTGSVYVCGETDGDLFGANAGGEDGFLACYSANGDLLVGHQFGRSAGEGASGVAVDTQGNVYVGGGTDGNLFGTSHGGEDAFLLRFAAVAQPTASPGGGTYASAQSITITCATDGATIRYTTDGSEPTESSPEYTVPVTVDHTLTLKARAWKTGYIPSYVRSAQYTIQ